MSNLKELISSGPEVKPARVILAGVPAVGKTTAASKSPKPVYIPVEDGMGVLEAHKLPKPKSFDEVMGYLKMLYSEDHPFQTVVIDTVDALEPLIHQKVCEDQNSLHGKNHQNIEDIGYGKGYTMALQYWHRLLTALDALRNEKGIGCCLISHTTIRKYDSPDTESYDRFYLSIHKAAGELLTHWCDALLFATYKVFTKKEGEGFKQKTRAVGESERVVYTTERPAWTAKNRFQMPSELPLDWQVFDKYFNPQKKGK